MGRPSRHAKVIVPDYAEGVQFKIQDEDPRFNTALARGLAILKSFHVDVQLLSNDDIARRTGIPKSTISRLTYTLTQLGYLQYREEFGKYQVAAGVVGLAYPYISRQQTPAAARPMMLALAERTKTNVGLGVHEGLSVLYLEYAAGDLKSNRRQRVGFRVPLVRTAMGRACVAAMTPPERADLLERMRAYYPDQWGALWTELEAAIDQEQRYGYCTAVNTFDRSTSAVAVPYRDDASGNILAFNSQAPSHWLTTAKMARIGKELSTLARDVRKKLSDGFPLKTPG